jgi:hypothetical protein
LEEPEPEELDEEPPAALEDPAAERPVPEALLAPAALDPDPLDELSALEALVVPLADTTSPT